jgi:hypothetical protein
MQKLGGANGSGRRRLQGGDLAGRAGRTTATQHKQNWPMNGLRALLYYVMPLIEQTLSGSAAAADSKRPNPESVYSMARRAAIARGLRSPELFGHSRVGRRWRRHRRRRMARHAIATTSRTMRANLWRALFGRMPTDDMADNKYRPRSGRRRRPASERWPFQFRSTTAARDN